MWLLDFGHSWKCLELFGCSYTFWKIWLFTVWIDPTPPIWGWYRPSHPTLSIFVKSFLYLTPAVLLTSMTAFHTCSSHVHIPGDISWKSDFHIVYCKGPMYLDVGKSSYVRLVSCIFPLILGQKKKNRSITVQIQFSAFSPNKTTSCSTHNVDASHNYSALCLWNVPLMKLNSWQTVH